MVLKKLVRILLLFLVGVTTTSLFSENQTIGETQYRKGILLLNSGSALSGEVGEFQDFYFIRNFKIGKKIPKDQVVDFVSEEYYNKIKHSSNLKSAFGSLVFFNASADKQWRGFPQDNSPNDGRLEDFFTLWIKISLLLLTAAAYADADERNHSLKNAYSGFNEREKHAFQNSYTRYQILGGIAIGFFTFTTLKAYVRFGKNDHYKDLQIQGRELRSFGETVDPRTSMLGIPNIQFAFTLYF
ncbi:hypothetical protein L9Z41_11265 [Leptospira noguchii]|uniref:hypothetical protein n=1 Tax=Leptospira noguchii TaxID=28182 RepID=UPI001F06F263|nr:hypothetical protein [Leptospira noguchii]MCH1912495.1 hypothetical protein [Leptospira noguchii]MCH1916197.1 hypothetical protein [Leptospira noguchii]UOG63574.1 hypothetical protein MAL04_15140 [Leptospira noguchii]